MAASSEGASTQRPQVRTFIKQFSTNSRPAHVDTDRGEFVIKAMNNEDGPPALIADWVGTNAARWLGVPVPDSAIVELSELIEVPIDADGQTLAQAGPCFGSSFVRAYGWDGDAKSLASVENVDAIAGVVVADTWLRNLDRFCRHDDGKVRFDNPGNLLLVDSGAAKGKFRLIAIDFGHAFGGPSWTMARLSRIDSWQDDTKYGIFPAFEPYMEWSRVRPFLDRLSRLNEADARNFVDGIPAEWGLSRDGADVIVEFLRGRATHLAKNLRNMVCMDDTLWTMGPEH